MAPRGRALEDAVRAADGGVALDVEVQPGAKAEAFPAGFNPWRGRVQARVAAQAQDGAANAALVGLVAAFFGVPAARVALVGGATSRQKTLLVRGLARDAALDRLRPALEAA